MKKYHKLIEEKMQISSKDREKIANFIKATRKKISNFVKESLKNLNFVFLINQNFANDCGFCERIMKKQIAKRWRLILRKLIAKSKDLVTWRLATVNLHA